MKQSLSILRGSQILPSLIHYLLSQITSHQGLHKILIFIVYELLRLKLPALLRVLQTFQKYQSGQAIHDDKGNHCNKTQNDNQSPQQLPQLSYSPGDKADRLQILAEVQRKFFEDEWKAHADEIKEEVVHLFNIEKQLSELTRTLNNEKKEQQEETLKRNILCFIPFSIVSSTLLITTHFLHQLLNTKHSHYLTHNFPALHDPQEIARSLLHDFMEQTQLAGLKNVKAYFKQKLTQTLHHLPVQEVFNLETLFEYLDEYFLGTLLRSNSSIKRPSDHRKRSSMTLFRNGRRKSLNSSNNNNSNSPCSSSQFFGQHVNFTDFNEIVNFSKFASNQCSDHQHETVNAALFAGSQPIVAQKAMLDIMYLFLGDVSENKILTDSEFVEKHIEIADCKCREQRYQPSLQCIPEDEGDDEDGYESDKSDQPIYQSKIGRNRSQNGHNIYQIKDKTANGQTEKMKNQIAALTKRRKYSFENDENQQEAPTKPPRRRKLSEEDQELLIQQQKTTQQKEEEEAGYNDDDEEHDGEEEGVEGHNGQLKNSNQPVWKASKKDKQTQKSQESKELNSKVKSPRVDFFQHLEFGDDVDEYPDATKLESLTQHRFLSEEAVDENEKQKKNKQKFKDNQTQNVSKKSNKVNKEASSSRATKQINKSQKFDMNLVDFQQHIDEDQDIDEDEENQEESNVYYSKLSKNGSSLDEEDIAENRQRLSQFVQSLCSEAVEILSSVNFQSYLYYAALFQYSKLKNRVRLSVQENNGSKHMSLQNFLILVNKVINEHFLDSDAPDKGKDVYKQARQDAQSFLNQQASSGHKHNNLQNNHHQSSNQNGHQNTHIHHNINSSNSGSSAAVTKNKLILLKLLLDEIEQSRTIRQSFEQLTYFFALS